MCARRKHRTHGGAHLWHDTPDGVEPGEVRDNPRQRPCRWCHARTGEPCTVPGRNGRRRPMTGYHDKRTQQEG